MKLTIENSGHIFNDICTALLNLTYVIFGYFNDNTCLRLQLTHITEVEYNVQIQF